MQTVIGIFSDTLDAQKVVTRLEEEGFNTREMSIVAKKGGIPVGDMIGAKGGTVAAGTVSGATAGGVIGGLAGLLIGLGAITIPGIGALLIGGPLAAALGLTGAAATTISGVTTGLLAGGLVGALISLGIPEEAAQLYQERIKQGAALLAVPVRDASDARQVRDIFAQYNADQVRTIDELVSH